VTTIIKNARVLAMDDGDTELARADILVRGTTVAAVGPGLPWPVDEPDLRVIEAEGFLAMPGLLNGHFHSPGNLMKGMLDGLPLELFMLYEVPPFAQTPPAPRLAYVRTMLGALEMLRIGVTAVHDDAFYVPVPTPETIDAVMQAYEDSGMRVAATLDQPNVVEYEKYPYLRDLLPEALRRRMEAAPRPAAAELLRLYRHLIDRWHGAASGRLRAAVSCSAPQRVSPDYLAGLADLSRKHDLPFDLHVLETKVQRVLGQERYGTSLVRRVADLGLLDERMLVIHAIWVDDPDIRLLADAGCTVAHNPVCNLRLGSGIMPFRRLREAGVPICLGSDEMTTDDTANMWGVAKLAALLHTLTDPEPRRWPAAPEVLWALTRGGARGMRLAGRVGAVAPGYEADLILVDLATLAFTPLNDLRRQLVFCENGSSVVLTMVAGRVVAERGRVLTVDEAAIKAEVRALMPEYRAGLACAETAARELRPYYEEMYLRAAARDVGLHRRLERPTP
jgi:5-methylthioadenosine/S-adenosylhomocysteine deaminase